MWRSLAGSALALVLLGIFAPVNGQGTSNSQGTSPSPQGGKPPDPELRGQWLRVGQIFACKVEAGKRITPPDSDVLSFACQRMGALGVGISEASLKAVLGEPHRKLPQPNNATAYVTFSARPASFPILPPS